METSTTTHGNAAGAPTEIARGSDSYRSLARRERAAVLARVSRHLFATGARWLGRLRHWYEHRALLRTLEQLEPWQLKDIGISRNDLQAIADGSFLDDPTRRPRHPRLTVIATTEASWIDRRLPGIRAPARPARELPRTVSGG